MKCLFLQQYFKRLEFKGETNGPQDQPRQKPKAKLRDSFIFQEDDQSTVGHLAEVNNLNRGLSLKSIIQKHENIATNGSKFYT